MSARMELEHMRQQKLAELGLPEYCFSTLLTNGETVKIQRGEMGYFPVQFSEVPAEDLNKNLGVSLAQATAMKMGSMFGWNCPGANPKTHEEET